ncbi:MAG: ubiquinol-cytochrome c reductase iron-sulfur subunit [Actinomycetes bacterium]
MKNRRNILKIMFVGAISFVVAACTRNSSTTSEVTQSENTTTPETTQTETSTETNAATANVITTINELAVGQSLEFTSLAGTSAILFRSSENKVYALSRICTHEGCSVDFDMNQNRLICPCHGANYEASDGSVISGPTTKSLAKIKVEIQGQDIVELV